jgi:hypothetical protein
MNKVKLFEDYSKPEGFTFSDAFEKYVKGQKVVDYYMDTPLIYRNYEWVYHYAEVHGLIFENGYVYASHGGGGCSGEDCNTTYIINNENKVITQNDW